MKEPRRLPLLAGAGKIRRTLPTWPDVNVAPHVVAVAESGGDGVGGALQFAVHIAEAWSERGCPPWTAVCAFDAAPQLGDAQEAALRRMSQSLTLSPIRNRDDLVGLWAQALRDAAGPFLFVGAPAVLGLRGAVKLVLAGEGGPTAVGADPLERVASAVLFSPRTGLARFLADALAPRVTTSSAHL